MMSKRLRQIERRLACAFATIVVSLSCVVASDADDVRDKKLLRFEFDNDTLLGSDDAFTAGWSLQLHSPIRDEWTPGLAGWIGRLPTLGDDGTGGRVVRWGWGITQLIVTP